MLEVDLAYQKTKNIDLGYKPKNGTFQFLCITGCTFCK